MNNSDICNYFDIIFNNTFTDKNSFLFDNLKLDQFDLTYKNKYILNLINCFCNKPVYQPFIDTFYLNRKFDLKLNDLFFNEHFIYLFSFCDYFQNNPFIDFDTYISNPNNSIFIFDYFINFCSKCLIDYNKNRTKMDDDDDMFIFNIPDATSEQINTFFNDLKFFYNIAYILFNMFHYIFYCFIFRYKYNFNNNIKSDLENLYENLINFKSDLFFSQWLSKTILTYLKIIIENLNNDFLLYNFYNLKFLIEFCLSFHYFYIINIYNNFDDYIFNMYNLSNVFYFRSILNDNIYFNYLSKFKILSNINDHTIFNSSFHYFTSNMLDIQYSSLYYLLKSLKYIYNKLLLPINFDFNDVVKYNLNDKQSKDTLFENINRFEKYISNFFINDKLRFNHCLIDSYLINISDTNNYFICINNILDLNCLAFNTNLFSITYDNHLFYYNNNFHSITFSKQKFFLYFFNLFFNNNFYFFILSPNYRNFNNNKQFLLNLLPYIDYNIKNTFNTSLFNFLSLNIDVEFLYIPIINICPLYFKLDSTKTFANVCLILIIYFFESRDKFYTNFNYIIDNLKLNKNDIKDKDRKLVFFCLLYIFIYIYISNTIKSFNNIESFRILHSDTPLVDFKFIYKCAYLFNLYFINFLYKISDLSNNSIKIKSYIRDDIIKSCNIENNNFINEVRQFHTDPDVNMYLMFILNECAGYQTEKNDVFDEIGLYKVVTITNVIKKYVVSSDDNYFSNENISDKFYSNKFEEMYKNDNDNFDFNVYNILYQI